MKTAFCAFRSLEGSGLSVSREKTLPSLSLKADLFGIYGIHRNPCQGLCTETHTGDLSHMFSTQIWEEMGSDIETPPFSCSLAAPQPWADGPFLAPTYPAGPFLAANGQESGRAREIPAGSWQPGSVRCWGTQSWVCICRCSLCPSPGPKN